MTSRRHTASEYRDLPVSVCVRRHRARAIPAADTSGNRPRDGRCLHSRPGSTDTTRVFAAPEGRTHLPVPPDTDRPAHDAAQVSRRHKQTTDKPTNRQARPLASSTSRSVMQLLPPGYHPASSPGTCHHHKPSLHPRLPSRLVCPSFSPAPLPERERP